MDILSKSILRIFISEDIKKDANLHKSAIALLEGYVSLVLNAVLAAAKFVIGIMAGSVALVADAVHTLSDCLSSGVLVAGAYISRKRPDKEHPFGHGRIEHVAAIIISIMLAITAIEFGRASIQKIAEPNQIEAKWWMIIAIIVTILVKYWNGIFALNLSKEVGSKAIEADFWHHMTDVLATSLAVIGMIAGHFGVLWLDGVMGIGVSLIILWAAWHIGKQSVSPLLGESPSQEELDEINSIAMSVEGVQGIHDVVIHRYGELRLISLHAEVSHNLSLWKGHNIAEEIQQKIADGRHGTVTVHIDPVNNDHGSYEEVRSFLDQIAEENDKLSGIHDVRLIGDEESFAVVFDVSVAVDIPDQEQKLIRSALEKMIMARFGKVREVSVSFEQLFSYNI